VTTKRVKLYMELYGSQLPINCVFDKLMIESQATHVEERELHVINQGYHFIKKHFDIHMIHVSRIEARLWDMRRYKRYKACKWPAMKERKAAKSIASSGIRKNKILKKPNTLATGPSWEAADSLDVDKDSDPFASSRMRPQTMKNPVHEQAHFEKMTDIDRANQHSTKSSDDSKGHLSYNPVKGIQNIHPDDVHGYHDRQQLDLPYDPREQRNNQARPQLAHSKSNLGIRSHHRGNSHEYRNMPGDGIQQNDRGASGAHPFDLPHQGEPFKSPQLKALYLKDTNTAPYTKPPTRVQGIGLGGFPVNNQPLKSPHTFKRSETQYDPATSHLSHLGNPYLRKQKSNVVEMDRQAGSPNAGMRGIQLKPLPSTSGHNYLAHQVDIRDDNTRKRSPVFDDDDLSMFLDGGYKKLEQNDGQIGVAANLDDSMISDLNTLNMLLKAKPH
jgi:hypothetical protein